MTEPLLDLLLPDTHNPLTLLVADGSTYPADFVPIAPSLAIKVPGFPERTLPFDAGNMMVFTAGSLGLAPVSIPFPDGLYRFTYTLSPAHLHRVEKYFLRTVDLEERLDRLFISLHLVCDPSPDDLEALYRVRDYLQGAVSAANQCQQKLATDLYRKALSTLNALNTC